MLFVMLLIIPTHLPVDDGEDMEFFFSMDSNSSRSWRPIQTTPFKQFGNCLDRCDSIKQCHPQTETKSGMPRPETTITPRQEMEGQQLQFIDGRCVHATSVLLVFM